MPVAYRPATHPHTTQAPLPYHPLKPIPFRAEFGGKNKTAKVLQLCLRAIISAWGVTFLCYLESPFGKSLLQVAHQHVETYVYMATDGNQYHL
jgi:hypothetical protein